MNEQASVSDTQKALLTTHLQELEQEIAQKEVEIRGLEQPQTGAPAQPPEGQLSLAQQTLAAMRKNADVIRAQLEATAVPLSTVQTQQPGGADRPI